MAEKDAIEDKAMQIVQKLHLSNTTKDEEGKYKISSQDLTRAKQMINDVLSDNVFKKQVYEMPDTSTFRKMVQFIDAPVMYAADRVNAKSKIGDIAQSTMRDIQNIVMSPNLDNETKRKEIQKTYKTGIENAIRAKYYWIPDLQNKPLIENETILNINGTQYLYKGIGDDIFLEVKE